MTNKSGIYPAGNRVLVYPDPIKEKMKDSLIELLPDTIEAQQSANASGVVTAIGPDAYQHRTEWVYNNREELVEKRVSGYGKPFAVPGDRVSYAKYAGQKYTGIDGERYVVLNDEDITCKIDDGIELTDLNVRKGAGL